MLCDIHSYYLKKLLLRPHGKIAFAIFPWWVSNFFRRLLIMYEKSDFGLLSSKSRIIYHQNHNLSLLRALSVYSDCALFLFASQGLISTISIVISGIQRTDFSTVSLKSGANVESQKRVTQNWWQRNVLPQDYRTNLLTRVSEHFVQLLRESQLSGVIKIKLSHDRKK